MSKLQLFSPTLPLKCAPLLLLLLYAVPPMIGWLLMQPHLVSQEHGVLLESYFIETLDGNCQMSNDGIFDVILESS